MKRGTKPVPTMLAELHGNPNKARKPNPHEPKPVGDLFDPPDHFSAEQKAGWVYALTNAPPGLLKRLDRGVLAVWVVAEDLHRQATIRQSKAPLVLKAPHSDAFIQSPWLAIINRQATLMLKAAGELGFTPVSRPRIDAAGPTPGQDLHGGHSHRTSLDNFLASDPDAPRH